MNAVVASADPAPRWIAHKFGGSSLADAGRIRHVADILLGNRGAPQVVVVSAMQGVTDALIQLAQATATAGPEWRAQHAALHQRHREALRGLGLEADATLLAWLDTQFADLAHVLHAAALIGAPAPETLAYVQGLGEVWSSRLLVAHCAARGAAGRLAGCARGAGDPAGRARRGGRVGSQRAAPGALARSACRAAGRRRPASSPATRKAASPRWAATAATTPARSSPPCSAPASSTSGPTSTACSAPIRGWCPKPCWSRSCPMPRPASWPTSAPRSSIRRPCSRRSRARSRSASATPSSPRTRAA